MVGLEKFDFRLVILIVLLIILIIVIGMLIINFSDDLLNIAWIIGILVAFSVVDINIILDILKENKNYKIEQEMIAEEKEKEKETVKKINEIFKSNRTILRIELTAETEDMVERRIRL